MGCCRCLLACDRLADPSPHFSGAVLQDMHGGEPMLGLYVALVVVVVSAAAAATVAATVSYNVVPHVSWAVGLNVNETWRNATQKRANALNIEYGKLVAQRRGQFKNFKVRICAYLNVLEYGCTDVDLFNCYVPTAIAAVLQSGSGGYDRAVHVHTCSRRWWTSSRAVPGCNHV